MASRTWARAREKQLRDVSYCTKVPLASHPAQSVHAAWSTTGRRVSRRLRNLGIFFAQWLNAQWLQLSLPQKAEPKQSSCLMSSRWQSVFRYKAVQHCLVPCLQGNRLFPVLNNAVEKKENYGVGHRSKQSEWRETNSKGPLRR